MRVPRARRARVSRVGETKRVSSVLVLVSWQSLPTTTPTTTTIAHDRNDDDLADARTSTPSLITPVVSRLNRLRVRVCARASERARSRISSQVPAASAAETKSESTSVSPVSPIAPPVRGLSREIKIYSCRGTALPVRDTRMEFTRFCVTRDLNLPPVSIASVVSSDRP